MDLLKRAITWITGDTQEFPVDGITEQFRQISLDSQVPEPALEKAQKLPDDHTDPSEDNPSVRNPENGRREGHSRGVSTHKHGRGDQLHSRSREQVTRLRNLKDSYRQLGDEHKSLNHSHCQLSEEYQGAITNLQETQIMCKKQQQEIDTLREKLRSTSALLEVRNQELKVAKTFLSREDTFSTFDVLQSVRDLNSEIMQTAAHLAENLALKRSRNPLVERIPEGPYKPILVALILPQGSGDEVDGGSLELAIQGLLAIWVYWIASAWGFSQASGWCDDLYSKICAAEDRTVASNWRALTRRTLFSIDSNQEDLPFQIVNDAIEQLAVLLSFCGVGEPSDNAANIRKYAADKFGSLFTAARKLNKMIGENVVSDDLMVTVIGGGHLFDAKAMEDASAWGKLEPTQRVVICTTDLGLCERKGKKGENILLKPKVILRNL